MKKMIVKGGGGPEIENCCQNAGLFTILGKLTFIDII